MTKYTYDASIIGSGPNGLAAAITLARAGLSVIVYEAMSTPGGGMRSGELTLPGFTHDICSTIHPLAVSSPFFREIPLQQYGLEWVYPEASLAHPLDNGTAVILERSIEATCQTFGKDSLAYQKLMQPLVEEWPQLVEDILAPLHFPQHPLAVARLGWLGLRSAQNLLNHRFQDLPARALFAGLAAHAIMPLNKLLTAAFGLILGTTGHAVGWPMAKGGSQNIANALVAYLHSLGGEIVTDTPIESIDQLASSKVILCDTTPRQLLGLAGPRLPSNYRRKLEAYRYGPGVFKIDWALNSPIPWQAKECSRAGTVHIGCTAEEIIDSEQDAWDKKLSKKPFVLVAQQSLFDSTRAPEGKHTAWAYCHVANGSTMDMTGIIESQIERFAPHFRDCILARSTMSAVQMEIYNPNYIGGDINGGVQDIFQFLTRPTARIDPYSTPLKGLYLCSSSTPPGGGVHGMCGYHAAQAVLKACF